MTIRLFAAAADVAGTTAIASQEELRTVRDVRHWLAEAYPAGKALWAKCLIAVDQVYAEDEQLLGEHCEVAVIPPVSGG